VHFRLERRGLHDAPLMMSDLFCAAIDLQIGSVDETCRI